MTISILDPRLWLALIVTSVVSYGIGDFNGRSGANKAHELELAKLSQEAEREYRALQDLSDRTAGELRMMIDLKASEFEKERKNAQAQIDSLRRDVVSGAYRLSVPVASCPASPFSAGSRSTAGVADTERAELLPTTALDLIDIAADADAEVRRTNLCINAYNEVKRQFDEYRKSGQ